MVFPVLKQEKLLRVFFRTAFGFEAAVSGNFRREELRLRPLQALLLVRHHDAALFCGESQDTAVRNGPELEYVLIWNIHGDGTSQSTNSFRADTGIKILSPNSRLEFLDCILAWIRIAFHCWPCCCNNLKRQNLIILADI